MRDLDASGSSAEEHRRGCGTQRGRQQVGSPWPRAWPSVNRCRCRVTLGQASPLEEVQHILALAEEQPVGGARDGDPEEVVQLTKVRHGELGVKTSGDASEQV